MNNDARSLLHYNEDEPNKYNYHLYIEQYIIFPCVSFGVHSFHRLTHTHTAFTSSSSSLLLLLFGVFIFYFILMCAARNNHFIIYAAHMLIVDVMCKTLPFTFHFYMWCTDVYALVLMIQYNLHVLDVCVCVWSFRVFVFDSIDFRYGVKFFKAE